MRAGIVTLVVAYVLSQFYRAFLAVMAPVLNADIGATPEDLSRASGLWFLVFASMQIPVGWLLDNVGPKKTSSILFGIGAAGGAALFAVAFTGETLHPLVGLGTAGVVGGLIFASGTSILEGWRGDKMFVLGYLMALGAGASYGATNVMAKHTLGIYDSPLMMTAFSMLIGLVVLSPLVGASAVHSGVIRPRSPGGPESHAFLRSLWSFKYVALAGIASGVAVISWYFAVQRADVVVISPIVSSSPLVTLFLAHLFLTRLERVTRRLVFGALLTVAGVGFVVVGSQL